MGTYTTNYKFYKPLASEFVDVDSQVNYNLDRADLRVKSMVEWQHTFTSFISGTLSRELGYKFYKYASNSLWVCTDNNGSIFQHSSNAQVDSFSTSGISELNNFQSRDQQAFKVAYRKSPSSGLVSWRGAMQLNASADQIPLNTTFTILSCPTAAPVRTKYFITSMGNADGSFSIVRMVFKTDGGVDICRMGSNQTDANERYISFNDIQYHTADN